VSSTYEHSTYERTHMRTASGQVLVRNNTNVTWRASERASDVMAKERRAAIWRYNDDMLANLRHVCVNIKIRPTCNNRQKTCKYSGQVR
jgi:hypothetical protein